MAVNNDFNELHAIRRAACAEFKIALGDLLSAKRGRRYVEARGAVVVIARRRNFSLQYIADMLGGRDHTTVMHAYTTTSDRLVHDDSYRMRVGRICEAMKPRVGTIRAKKYELTVA